MRKIIVIALLLMPYNLYAKTATAKDYLNLITECESSVCVGKIIKETTKKISNKDVSFYTITYNNKQYILNKVNVYTCSNQHLIDSSVVFNTSNESLQATVLECAN